MKRVQLKRIIASALIILGLFVATIVGCRTYYNANVATERFVKKTFNEQESINHFLIDRMEVIDSGRRTNEGEIIILAKLNYRYKVVNTEHEAFVFYRTKKNFFGKLELIDSHKGSEPVEEENGKACFDDACYVYGLDGELYEGILIEINGPKNASHVVYTFTDKDDEIYVYRVGDLRDLIETYGESFEITYDLIDESQIIR